MRSTWRERTVSRAFFPPFFHATRLTRVFVAAAAKPSEAAEIKAETGLLQNAEAADRLISKDEKLEASDAAIEKEMADAHVRVWSLLLVCARVCWFSL